MSEAAALQAIRLDLGRVPGLRLFRNNCGALRDHTGRLVRYGLHPGSSDLVGWRSVTITPEHIGQTLAVFASIEVKAPGGRHPATAEQQAWIDALRAAGGIGGVANNPAQARHILGLAP